MKKPELNSEMYSKSAEFMAKRIAARAPGTPTAVLATDTLELLQENALAPFWQEEFNADPPKIEYIQPRNLNKGDIRSSLDLHVGTELLILSNTENDWKYTKFGPDCDSVDLPPSALTIIKSHEYFFMPPFLCGFVVTPVHAAMCGLSNISTMIDPKFEGFLLLNFVNLSPWPVTLKYNSVISRVVFHMVAYTSELRKVGKYPRDHGDAMDLRSIINKRINDKELENRVFSSNLKGSLVSWIKQTPTSE